MPILVKIITPVCTCGDRLGYRQKEFEDLVEEGLAQHEAIKKMGIRKMCCVSKMINCPVSFINDSNSRVYIDETKDEYGNRRAGLSKPFTMDRQRIIPKKEI